MMAESFSLENDGKGGWKDGYLCRFAGDYLDLSSPHSVKNQLFHCRRLSTMHVFAKLSLVVAISLSLSSLTIKTVTALISINEGQDSSFLKIQRENETRNRCST